MPTASVYLQSGSDEPPRTTWVPPGWSVEETIAAHLRAAMELANRSDSDALSSPQRAELLKRFAAGFHDAAVELAEDELFGGPAMLGKLLNGRVSDTGQRYCVEPVMVMRTTLQTWITSVEDGAGGYTDRAALFFAYMMLKGWVYDAVTNGSAVFRFLGNDDVPDNLFADICRELLAADELIQQVSSQDWRVGAYDRQVFSAPTDVLVAQLRHRAGLASV